MLDTRTYPALASFPATGPKTGPARPTPEGRVVRVLLAGTTFGARVQISNAINTGPVTDALFVPPETAWTTYGTITNGGGPVDIPAPVRWVRVVLDSGTLTGGTIEEDSRAAPRVYQGDLLPLVQQRVDQALPGMIGPVVGQEVEARVPSAVATALYAPTVGRVEDQGLVGRTEGFDPTKYTFGLARTLTTGSATDPTRRYWAMMAGLTVGWDSPNTLEEPVALNGRAILEKSQKGAWAQLNLIQIDRKQIPGLATVTNGSTAVTITPGSGDLVRDLMLPCAVFLSPDHNPSPTYQNAYVVASINSATSLTLVSPWQGPTLSNVYVYRTVAPGPAGARSGGYAGEFDVNNRSGFHANADVEYEYHGLAIASGGDFRPADALMIYKGAGTSYAPFFNGVLFKDDGIYQAGVRFANVNPEFGLSFTDSFGAAGGSRTKAALDLANGITKGLQFRMPDTAPGHNPGLIAGNSNKLEVWGGVDGVAISRNERDFELWRFDNAGELISKVPGRGLSLLRVGNGGVDRLFSDAAGNPVWVDKIIPRQGAAVIDSTASDVAGLKTDFNGLLAKLRAAKVIA